MVCPAAKRSRGAQVYLDQLRHVNVDIAWADALSQAFLVMVREHRGHDLKAWVGEAIHNGIEALARFARGSQDELTAIKAGLTPE